MMGGVIIDSSHYWHIEIGDNVTLAPRVHILAHDASTKKFIDYTRIGKVKIGNNVFIGASAIILPGITIGNNVIIGASSVVTKSIKDNEVVAGNPARFIMDTDDFISKRKKEMQSVPVFDESYTLRQNVSEQKKEDMNRLMKNNIGYII